MLQLVKKSRSGWSLLAVGALVASVLVVGAGPAAAVTDRADHTTRLSACVGAAAADRMFTDVSQGHVFRPAINCIAYYGITQGTGDGSTYSPKRHVTRAEMAVFIARAAAAAGVELGSGDAGFDDIGGAWQEARDAINGLAVKGMIPSSGSFRPNDDITRAEMATFLIGLLAEATDRVTVDAAGTVRLRKGSLVAPADDYFADAQTAVSDPATLSAISALYELGVTNGTGSTPLTGDVQPGLDLYYSPDGVVSRGQMAAFITRALSHTVLRPRGVSAQYDGADIVVSVRDDQLRPVAGAAVDVLWVPSADAGGAFAADRICDQANRADHSSRICAIDETDPATGRDGDARVAVTALLRIPEGGATVWAWTGQLDDEVRSGTEVYWLDIAEGAHAGFATQTLVTTTFTASRARLGSSLSYRLQLRDGSGDVTHGSDGETPAQWSLAMQTVDGNGTTRSLDTQHLESNDRGRATFTIRVSDPNPGAAGDQMTATYTLAAIGNAPPEYATVHSDGSPAATGTVIFSDQPGSISQATTNIETVNYVHVSTSRAFNFAEVTVLDQYGSPIRGAKVKLESDSDNFSVTEEEFSVNSRGSHRFTYEYTGSGGETEELSVSYGLDSADQQGATATVHWAVDAGPNDQGPTLAGDVRRKQIVVDDGDGPVLLTYDDSDRFNVAGRPATLAVFEAQLADVLNNPGRQLAWSNYEAGRAHRVAEFSLI